MTDFKVSDGTILSGAGATFLFLLEWCRRLEKKVGIGMTRDQKQSLQTALGEIKEILQKQNESVNSRHAENTSQFTKVAVRLAVIETRMGIKGAKDSSGELP